MYVTVCVCMGFGELELDFLFFVCRLQWQGCSSWVYSRSWLYAGVGSTLMDKVHTFVYTQILDIKQHQQGAIGGLYAFSASPLPGLASWKHLAHYSYSYAAQTIIKLITDCVLMKCSKTADSK